MSLIDAVDATAGLWTALAALAATVAAYVAIASSMLAYREIKRAESKDRPWLGVNKTAVLNRQGGFEVDLGVKNYGGSLAPRHRLRVWRATLEAHEVVYDRSSATDVAPNQDITWPLPFK